jgi:hypothetical protein
MNSSDDIRRPLSDIFADAGIKEDREPESPSSRVIRSAVVTHSQALALPRPASVEASDCDGELVPVGNFRDTSYDADGKRVSSIIDVYRCLKCEARLSVRAGRVLNAYPTFSRQSLGTAKREAST